MRLKELTERMQELDPALLVVLSGDPAVNGKSPDGFTSYRGIYAHLALEYGDKPRTVNDLLIDCCAADKATFHGWKGGDYVMDGDTPVWVDHAAACSGRIILDVVGVGAGVVIRTAILDIGYQL